MEIIKNIDKELLKKLYIALVDNEHYFLREWDLKIIYHLLILKDINEVKEVFLKGSLEHTPIAIEEATERFEKNWKIALYILQSIKVLNENYNLTFELKN